ncbi:Male sterility protein [Streptomyces sp. yr375]|uniref:SDR family oxidoreductase n=1 Tax=Streptomyces sp. yr375 TaxID=1761906 RepID=UPI0008B8BAEF|nr:SDR family oxidoreductase [Streptomyces sp. yr375]SER48017.1 Male sterility protein [Streptomyces sp. yr375]
MRVTSPSTPYLLTGSGGVIGQSLATALGPGRVIGLVREGGGRPGPGIETVTGDVTVPGLGLAPAVRGRLSGWVGGVIHSAAVTSFTRPADEIRQVNTDGTAHALRLAESAGVPFHLVSTVYVRRREGSVETGRSRVYRESKQAAEDLVRTARVPWTILRVTVVTGDSRTGATPRFQGIYAAMKALVTGDAPLVPVAPGSYIDFLPRDHVAACVTALLDSGTLGEHWITAGRRALTIERFVDHCLRYAERRGRPVAARPRLVDSEMVHRLILPAFGDSLAADLRKRLELFTDIVGPLATNETLPDPAAGLPAPPDLGEALDAALEYWGERVRLVRPGVRV